MPNKGNGWEDVQATLGPLRVRAQQLQTQAVRERDAAQQRWSQSEKPVLKEHAGGMKETMQLLAKEEAALQQRVASLSASTVKNNPGTSTGFNVIRARVDAYGRPLTTDALKAEKERLTRTLHTMEVEIAGAKAEITRHRRSEENEIWETKLVALQDTKRVYRDEINLIEVELLGREHYERMQRDRQIAEETGAAQLQRLQEHMLQTKIKMNRAKHQYYFPSVKGFNIHFGGAGIYGACKDICISEINGAAKVTMEPGGLGEDGMYHSARVIVQVESPVGSSASAASKAAATAANGNSTPLRSLSRRASFQRPDGAPGSTVGSERNGSVSGRPASAPAPSPRAQQSPLPTSSPLPPSSPQHRRPNSGLDTAQSERRMRPSAEDGEAGLPNLSRRSASFPSSPSKMGAVPRNTGSGAVTPQALSGAGTPRATAGAEAQPQQQEPGGPAAAAIPPAAAAAEAVPYPPGHPLGKPPKGKGFATRFLNRLSSKKDRFQGKEQPHLQPARDEDDMMGTVNQKRSLASKLLSRKASKRGGSTGGGGGSDASLDRLTFGGQGLTDIARRSSIMSVSADEDLSARRSNSVAEGSENSEDYAGLAAVQEDEGGKEGTPHDVEQHDEGDGSLASDSNDGSVSAMSDDDEESERGRGAGANEAAAGGARGTSPLTKDALLREASREHSWNGGLGSARSSWLRGGESGDVMSVMDDETSSVADFAEEDAAEAAAAGLGTKIPRGVYAMGRLSGFELIGERGTKVPNLTIGKADVRATVFARFVFEYSKQHGWRPGTRPGDRPMFHVDKLKYAITGNNVPMPQTLIKHILRIAIPGLIQRRLMGLLPKEFGSYLLAAKKGLEVVADVAVVGPALAVLDADLGFEVRGPAKSAKEARKQQAVYAAAKEARGLLGLSLPQAQVLAELFNGNAALLLPKRAVSVTELIAFQATYERFPKVYTQLLAVLDTAYHVLAQGMGLLDASDFSFSEFMATSVTRMRLKPARTRVVVRNMDVGINADAVVTSIHDFIQRSIEELIVKGPLTDPSATLQTMKETVAEEMEVLHAWHAFVLRELQHFKSKFRGAAGTVLAAADHRGFSGGIENCYYEGPLRLRLPLNIQLDQDGAFSFELPLPSPAGKLGVFMDNFKGLTVPSHLRPPAAAVNWVELTGDSEVDARMTEQMTTALGLIQGVIDELNTKIEQNGLEKDDEDPAKALSQPRTTVGDRLGRLFVNRLKVRVRLDERRIGEILTGLDGASMGGNDAFMATAGRIIGHLGDVMTLGFTPAAADTGVPSTAAGPPPAPDRYLFHFESSDISRLRADVQSLGFQSSITPGGLVRLVHAILRAAQLAFKERAPEELEGFRDQMAGWYTLLTREQLNASVCVDTAGEVAEGGSFIVRFSGRADDDALRATSPLVLTNEINLVSLGMAMRGDTDKTFPKLFKDP